MESEFVRAGSGLRWDSMVVGLTRAVEGSFVDIKGSEKRFLFPRISGCIWGGPREDYRV